MPEKTAFIIAMILGMASVLSPLMTSIAFCQLKEWRFDRLQEHLTREGWWITCFGRVRPALALLFLLTMLGYWLLLRTQAPYYELGTMIWMTMTYGGFLTLFSLLSIAQIFLRKQRYPVWTSKAMLTTLLSMSIVVALLIFALQHELLSLFLTPLIVGFPAIIVFIAWIALVPLDRILKLIILSRAIRARSRFSNLTVIGITGSVGKTTTKELLLHLLKSRGALATPRHVNTEMGVARWLTKILRDEPVDSDRILIVEMGAYCQGEIALLASIVRPKIGILTYVGKQHLALFGSEENIADGKSELLDALPANGLALINADSPLIDRIKTHGTSKRVLIGTDRRVDLCANNIEETSNGVRFEVHGVHYDAPLAGTHMVTNIVLALTAARALGISTQELQKSLAAFQGFEQTFSVSERNGCTILNSTYNSSYESFLAALEWARKQPMPRKVLICDGIIELGDREASVHADLARRAKEIVADVYVLHAHFLPYFQDVFGDHARLLPQASIPQSPGALLLFIGRMPKDVIERFCGRG